jgi:RNA polymerase sigma factor (sigma-70 family)
MSPTELKPLLDQLAGPLVLYARQWCVSPEDIVQEAFIKLIQQRTKPDDPRAWLFRVVRNAAIDVMKSEKRRKDRENRVAQPESVFQAKLVDGLSEIDVQQALEALPDDEREVIVAHLWGGVSFEAIGQMLGCAASTAHRRYLQGLDQLRERWRDQ